MTKRRKRPLAESVLVAESPIHGRGCFARRKIREGERIGAYEGPSTMEDDTYVLWVYEGDGETEEWCGVDGANELRYMNHSSRANTEFLGVELFALRDIEAGEELTFHYGDEWAGVE
ncbi:MAG: SET domain-containing protein [Bryobacterales bacterium]|nr:SET domain-containing protein [Acidobacteriota bacterium]MCB9384126.1 SET domain-containing protein [Bryobacterales bacterium]